ncbi:MAG: hypothetical protein ACXVAX_08135 [Pseudobdellovibrio sp.]
MKNTLFITITSLLLSTSAFAFTLEAKPVADLLDVIHSSPLKYSETGMVSGFHSIKSCVYVSDQMIVIKNYCSPKKNYPAKGYTIISPKFGLIEFYQEQLSPEILKRDIRIDQFPDILKNYLPADLSKMTLADLNPMFDKLQSRYNPGCWSTNYSQYTETNDVNCSKNASDVVGLDDWKTESQNLTLTEASWLKIIAEFEDQFQD